MFKLLIPFIIGTTLVATPNIGSVKTLEGTALVKRDNRFLKLQLGSQIKKSDIINTKDNSNIGIIFQDGTIVTLTQNSILAIDDYIFKPATKEYDFDFSLNKGEAGFESGKIGKLSPQSVKFKIPDGIIGIRGTKFFVKAHK